MNPNMRKLSFVFLLLAISSVEVISQTAVSVETALLKRLANIEKWSNYSGNADYERLEKENELFKNDLLKFGKQPTTLSYAFPRLKKEMYVVTSRDGRLRIYSWDRQTGGTMHDFDSVYQYRGKSGKVHSWSATNEEDSGGVFYHDLFQLDSASGPIYLSVSSFIGSSSLSGASIDVMNIDSERLDINAKLIRTTDGLTNSINFGYDFFSVVDRKERPIKLFTFDSARRSFSFPVVIEDEKTPQGRVTNKRITYRFDGKYFVKVS